jgi:Protein of unknown function (DUF3108).
MNPIRSFVFFLVCFLSLAIPASAGNEGRCVPVGSLKEKDLPFMGGERLVFTIHYKWGLVNADVAKAEISLDTTVVNGRKAFHARIAGYTQKMYASLFTVKEDLQSWFTRDGLTPIRFTRQAREGNYTCSNNYSYVWSPGHPHIKAALNSSRKGDYYAEIPLDNCTFDIPLLYFMLRTMDTSQLKVGGRYPMTFAVDDDVYSLSFVYLGKENRKVSGVGSISCMKFGFQVVAGDVFTDGSDLFMWISDDVNKIPVYFQAPLKIGQVQGRLTGFSGLRRKFSTTSGQ